MRFEALQRFYYNGRDYRAGEQFEPVAENDIPALRLLWKEVKEVADEPPRTRYRTREMRRQ